MHLPRQFVGAPGPLAHPSGRMKGSQLACPCLFIDYEAGLFFLNKEEMLAAERFRDVVGVALVECRFVLAGLKFTLLLHLLDTKMNKNKSSFFTPFI